MDSHIDWHEMGTLEDGDIFTIAGQYEPRPWWKRAWWRIRYFKALPHTLQAFVIVGRYPPESPSLIEYAPRERVH